MTDIAPVRVRVTTPTGPIDLVWTLIRETESPLGRVVELAGAGRRLVVPAAWVRVTDEAPAALRAV